MKTSPSGQTCSINNGSGTIAAASITNVTVSWRERGHSRSAGVFRSGNGGLQERR